MELITKELSQIIPYENNPRLNDGAVDAVVASIEQCGYVAPIIVDEAGVILAGHTRYKALKRMGETETQVIVRGGLSEEQKRKYRLLDNKVGEIAEWDNDLLRFELEGLDFGDLDLDWDLNDLEELATATDDDYEVTVPEEPKSKRGQIFKLGRHRLMCGDSTSMQDVQMLMGGGTSRPFAYRPALRCGLYG